MKISIIIPVYNSEKYIGKVIDSIVQQNYKNYELILIDDGSTDTSATIIKEYCKKFKNIKYFYKDNSGPGYTRKLGFEKSNGDLIYFVDSDDWFLYDDLLKDVNEIFTNNTIDFLVFNRKSFPDGTILYPFGNDMITAGIHDVSDIRTKLIRGCLGCKIFKRPTLNNTMFSDTSNHEDFYTTYIYLDKCKNFYYLNKELLASNRYDDNISLTKRFNYNSYKQGIDNVVEIYNIIKNSNLKNSIAIEALNLYLSHHVVPLLRLKLFNKDKLKMFKYSQRLRRIIRESDLTEAINNKSLKYKIAYALFIKL